MQYETKNVKTKIILDNEKIISGTVNVAGYDRFSDFIENEKTDHLKLTDVTIDGSKYKFLLLNRKTIFGYYDTMEE
ncbi:MAG: hypothetical protein ACNA7H_09345 [Desulfotignum sp.]